MALTDDESRTLADLTRRLESTGGTDERLNSYYEGQQRLEHIGLAVPPQLRRFETVVNWPRLAVDSLEERLDVEGFRMAGAEDDDDFLWQVWQSNDLDEESELGHLDALIYGRAFTCVGTGDDGIPLVSVESPREMVATIDPRTRKVAAALKLYGRSDTDVRPQLAALYLPNVTIWCERADDGTWTDYDRDEHNIGEVPVTPIMNRRRTGQPVGRSELADVIPLTDAAARSLTNLQIAGETHSVPQKYALGVSKGDFVDKDGKPLPAWEAYFTAIWSSGNKDAKLGQFTASSLSNFHDTVDHYAKIVSSLTGLPSHYLGFSTENPASADAIRSAEARLVKRAERRQRMFGGSWERTMRLVLRFARGEFVPEARAMETVWRDASTPTVAAKADAIMKLAGVSPNRPVISVETAQEMMGMNQTQRDRERERLAAEAEDPSFERAVRAFRAGEPVNSGATEQ